MSGKLQELQYFGVFILNGFVSMDLIVAVLKLVWSYCLMVLLDLFGLSL